MPVEIDRLVIGSFNFYDGSVVMFMGKTQVFKIFRGMSARPGKFKMMFSKFKFFSA